MAETSSKQKKSSGKSAVALVGISGPDGTRYEKGDKVPAEFLKEHPWLVDAGKVKE